MPAQGPRPRPTSHRVFSVLVAFLLVGSLALAPIASAAGATSSPSASMTTATTQDDGGSMSFEGTCDSNLKYALPLSCGLAEPDDYDIAKNITEDETNLHVISTSEWESYQVHQQGIDNHLTDTNTIASLEARHAIAQAYENGSTEAEALNAALDAIDDYYAAHQKHHLSALEKAMMQHYYTVNTTRQSSVDDNFLSSAPDVSDYDGSLYDGNPQIKDGLVEAETILTNGETVTFQTLEVDPDHSSMDWLRFEPMGGPSTSIADGGSAEWREAEDDWLVRGGSSGNITWEGRIQTHNVGDQLESKTVWDQREWADRWKQIEEQSDTLRANYDSDLVSDLYAEMDAGLIDPEDVRGAEGQQRFLSGDSDVTSERFRLALQSMLDMSSPDLSDASSMVVEYSGSTGVEYTTENGERSQEYVDPVENETYQGLLFSNEVPDGGFETGVTYNTENLNGSVRMFDETSGETTDFEQGEFTVLEMYDSDGNEVDQAEWDDPKYDSRDLTEFAEYIENATLLQQQIQEQYEEDQNESGGDVTIDIGDGLGSVGENAGMLGIGLIAIALLAVAGFVLDLIPGLGN